MLLIHIVVFLFLSSFDVSFMLTTNQYTSFTVQAIKLMDTSLPSPISIHQLSHQPIPMHMRSIKYRKRRLNLLNNTKSLKTKNPEMNPIYPGYGTHFAYVYVGTPPQRQSVIIDTGSAYTGFPCAGCSKCGDHTDPYFNPAKSTSKNIPDCQNDLCQINMAYTEGSSWSAYAIVDNFYVGDIIPSTKTPAYAFPNYFACQTSVTGLFESQLADGIMGLSMVSTAIHYQMKERGVAETKVFALCFRNGGGVLTFGGVDQRIHDDDEIIVYTKLIENENGWYVVTLDDIGFLTEDTDPIRLNLNDNLTPSSKQEKLSVIDSGTTDTYLPQAFADLFKDGFKKATGFDWTEDDFEMSDDDLDTLPDIQFVFTDTAGNAFEVLMPLSSYVEDVGDNKYAYRIYFSEDTGSILGSNFLNGYNVIFDPEALRIGFALSDCEYNEVITAPDIDIPGFPNDTPTISECLEYEDCDAMCAPRSSGVGYLAAGKQIIKDVCKASRNSLDCHIPCDGNGKIVRGDPTCPDTPWSECSIACSQSRMYTITSGSCKMQKESRSCSSGLCPVDEGDFMILIDMKVPIEPKTWSYVHADMFIFTLETLFMIPTGSIDLLNDVSSEFSRDVRLHFQVHLRRKDYDDPISYRKTAEIIPIIAQSAEFGEDFIDMLNNLSASYDKIDYLRYAAMQDYDVQVTKAVSLPIGYSRDLDHPKHSFSSMSESETTLLILLGVAVGVTIVLSIVCCFYCRLRAEHDAMSKDKVMGGSLRRMWERFQNFRQKKRDRGTYAKVPLMRSTARMEEDDQLDEEDRSSIRV